MAFRDLLVKLKICRPIYEPGDIVIFIERNGPFIMKCRGVVQNKFLYLESQTPYYSLLFLVPSLDEYTSWRSNPTYIVEKDVLKKVGKLTVEEMLTHEDRFIRDYAKSQWELATI